MADVFCEAQRSEIMKKVHPSGNKSTELKMISIFKSLQITGWRRNYNVKGHPDFVFLKEHIAVFVDGCFWHGHDCRNIIPKTNHLYWDEKRKKNIEHDLKVTCSFQQRGWKVIRIWECELKGKKKGIMLEKIAPLIKKDN